MKENISKLIIWIVIASFFGGIIVLINHKVFQTQYSAPKALKEHLEFPFSKVTVHMDKGVMRKALDKCTWIDSSRGFRLSPVKGNEETFVRIVNRNSQAERISAIYGDEGFKWDPETMTLTLATDSKGVWVPTWILYELVSEGCFRGIK